jgi:predicted phosphodiesterase
MKVLIISDVHANLTALEAVLQAAGEVDAVWCLGDLVGYGPDPNECVERISWLPNLLCVKGNHDDAVAGEGDVEFFNDEAGASIMITRKLITPDNLHYLQQLPEVITTDFATLVHGSPRHPIWEYILDSHSAAINFSSFSTTLALVGHTHLPVAFVLDENGEKILRRPVKPGMTFAVKMKSIVNPGSVGQPRDFDPRASYVALDTETMNLENHRVQYDFSAVQERIRKLGMPEKHALRLSEGW